MFLGGKDVNEELFTCGDQATVLFKHRFRVCQGGWLEWKRRKVNE